MTWSCTGSPRSARSSGTCVGLQRGRAVLGASRRVPRVPSRPATPRRRARAVELAGRAVEQAELAVGVAGDDRHLDGVQHGLQQPGLDGEPPALLGHLAQQRPRSSWCSASVSAISPRTQTKAWASTTREQRRLGLERAAAGGGQGDDEDAGEQHVRGRGRRRRSAAPPTPSAGARRTPSGSGCRLAEDEQVQARRAPPPCRPTPRRGGPRRATASRGRPGGPRRRRRRRCCCRCAAATRRTSRAGRRRAAPPSPVHRAGADGRARRASPDQGRRGGRAVRSRQSAGQPVHDQHRRRPPGRVGQGEADGHGRARPGGAVDQRRRRGPRAAASTAQPPAARRLHSSHR